MELSTQSASKSGNGRLIVAAIDIGTTFSGYAYSLKDNPSHVIANQAWIAGGRPLLSIKTPTCLLLTPEMKFSAFGYEAENKYAELAEEENHEGWSFFQRFKMILHKDKGLDRNTMIEDITGKTMPALDIFAMSIRYLKDHLMDTLTQRITDVTLADITFVLTVPAIWNDKAKRFMRQAAVEAGIQTDQLLISLEPEAASIWCQSLKTEVKKGVASNDLGITLAGTKYMIVDIGGGTADIIVHEKMPNGTLREIHKASGGSWGGTEVDKAFIQLLSNIVGNDIMERFKKEHMADYLDILRDFEIKKRSIKRAAKGNIVIRIPLSLKELFDKSGKPTVADIKRQFEGKVEWKGDKIRFEAGIMENCFDHSTNKLIIHTRGILLEGEMRKVRTIMLVGGFAESALVQDYFRSKFDDKRLIIPDECGLVVLKGAVLFGHNPQVVSTRIARFTYGLEQLVKFDANIHPAEKYILVNKNEPVCRDIFWKAVEIGQSLPLGHVVSRVGRPANNYADCVSHVICKSTSKNPKFVTDADCEIIGEVNMDMDADKTSVENTFDEIFTFGGTEIKYSARHHASGEVVKLELEL